MAQQILTNGAKVVISYGTASTSAWSNSLWFTKASFDQAALDLLAENVHDWFVANVLPELSISVSLFQVTAYDMRTVGGPLGIYVPSPAPAGAKLGDMIPFQDAVVITLRSATRGRAGRGRNYLSGFTEGQSAGRLIDATTETALELAYDPAWPGIYLDGWTWVVASFQQDGVTLNPGVARPIIATEMRSRVYGVQKSRNLRD